MEQIIQVVQVGCMCPKFHRLQVGQLVEKIQVGQLCPKCRKLQVGHLVKRRQVGHTHPSSVFIYIIEKKCMFM